MERSEYPEALRDALALADCYRKPGTYWVLLTVPGNIFGDVVAAYWAFRGGPEQAVWRREWWTPEDEGFYLPEFRLSVRKLNKGETP